MSSVPSSTWVVTDSGTAKATTMPPEPLRSSSSTVASVTCTLPPIEPMRPFMASRVSLPAGIAETSTASHARVSRRRGPTRLKAPDAVGRAGSPDRVELACTTRSPGRVAVNFGTATAPPRASSCSATPRTGLVL